MISFAILLLSFVGPEDVLRERCDNIEVNNFYDENAKLVFTQIIFWNWDRGYSVVKAWRLVKSPAILPRKDWRTGDFMVLWDDGGTLREVRSKSCYETWTQYDVELSNREIVPKEHRVELLSAKRVKR